MKTLDSTDSYLCFSVAGIWYILPVAEVERICLPEDVLWELKWIGFGSGKQEGADRLPDQKPEQRTCVVILRVDSVRYGIQADLVEGVVEAPPPDQFEIPQVLQERYPWLLGASLDREKHRLLLLPDGQKLELLTDGQKTKFSAEGGM